MNLCTSLLYGLCDCEHRCEDVKIFRSSAKTKLCTTLSLTAEAGGGKFQVRP